MVQFGYRNKYTCLSYVFMEMNFLTSYL